MKLFAFYVGGETEASKIELHDMRFAVGERIEDCGCYIYPADPDCDRDDLDGYLHDLLYSFVANHLCSS